MKYQGIVIQHFGAVQDALHVKDDICRLERKIKECLEWSDTKLLRSILVFLDTQRWQESFGEDSGILESVDLSLDDS